ncbi:hypothetical protein [Zavarzinella formosa]|uniref:hypothetical protein n=1 Tax=Zavarzinella formosa TaxID=360055 RepID=UPI00036014C1|nr:hypothetical protein [Zavarzinella formosa]
MSNQAFNGLWKAWRPKEQVPNIDFSSYFVVIVTASKHTTRVMQINVADDGDGSLLTSRLSGEKEMDGFGYGLAVFQRAKLKTFGKKAIPAK